MSRINKRFELLKSMIAVIVLIYFEFWMLNQGGETIPSFVILIKAQMKI